MSLGFVMLAHTALNRAAQVARVISESGCPLVIHVDRRTSPRAFLSFEQSVQDLPGVTLAPRIDCDWGTWSLVQASRDAARLLLQRHGDVNHVALISGSCLPIKPIDDLRGMLAEHPETDFIESVTIEDVPWTQGGLSGERFHFTFPFAWKRNKRLFDLWVEAQRLAGRQRLAPDGIAPHMGSQWWCLTRRTLDQILSDPERDTFDRFFKRVWIPDESYYQTLVRHYDCTVFSRSLTLTKFDFMGKPHVFYDDHLPLLRQSPAYFARKCWPGANRLYRAFLERKPPNARNLQHQNFDNRFAQAVARRTKGRAGLVMTSRFPKVDETTPPTAAPYAAFHGFTDLFEAPDKWIEETTGGISHGHLFAIDQVEFHGSQQGFAGALSDKVTLRDYDPAAFLRNLVWNTRGQHQSFMLGVDDNPDIHEFLAADRNATIAVISGAWAVPLFASGQPIASVRKRAAACQKAEAEFLATLRASNTCARVLIWSLCEVLERPEDVLREIADSLNGHPTETVPKRPNIKPTTGLAEFLQALRNSGMNPYLAGELRPSIQDPTQGDTVQRLSV